MKRKLYQNIKHTLVYDNKTYYDLHVVNFQVICLIKNVKFNRRAKTKNKTKKNLNFGNMDLLSTFSALIFDGHLLLGPNVILAKCKCPGYHFYFKFTFNV